MIVGLVFNVLCCFHAHDSLWCSPWEEAFNSEWQPHIALLFTSFLLKKWWVFKLQRRSYRYIAAYCCRFTFQGQKNDFQLKERKGRRIQTHRQHCFNLDFSCAVQNLCSLCLRLHANDILIVYVLLLRCTRWRGKCLHCDRGPMWQLASVCPTVSICAYIEHIVYTFM